MEEVRQDTSVPEVQTSTPENACCNKYKPYSSYGLNLTGKIFVMISSLFLVVIATSTCVLLSFPPKHDGIDVELNILMRMSTLTYICIGVILLGLTQLTFTFVSALHCQDTRKQRISVYIVSIVMVLSNLVFLIVTAVNPNNVIQNTLLNQNEALSQPITEAIDSDLALYGSPGNQELSEKYFEFQMSEHCCMRKDCEMPGHGYLGNQHRPCTEVIMEFYSSWLADTVVIIQTLAIVFSSVLSVGLLGSAGHVMASYVKDNQCKPKINKSRLNFQYHPNVFSKFSNSQLLKNIEYNEGGESGVFQGVLDAQKGKVKDADNISSICVMPRYWIATW